MRKTIFLSFLTLLLIATLASAFNMPHPVYGKITSAGLPVSGLEVVVTNINTGATGSAFTDNTGFYMIELGNIDDRYVDGQQLRISLRYCDSLTKCVKTTIISGGGNEVTWDIETASLPVIPDTATIVKYICWDGSGVTAMADCPVASLCPDGVTQTHANNVDCPKKLCSDEKTEVLVGKESDCPLNISDSWIYGVIAVLVALLAGAGGWKFYNGKFKHYHKGISGYHHPNTLHTNPKYKHIAWKTSALKCISDVKKIQNGIDLSK
jgi:hypothetical protein